MSENETYRKQSSWIVRPSIPRYALKGAPAPCPTGLVSAPLRQFPQQHCVFDIVLEIAVDVVFARGQ